VFILFFVALEFNEHDRLNSAELCFMIFAFGFALEKVATMQEHGIKGIAGIAMSHDNLSLTFILSSIFQGDLGMPFA
jgi:hypothetical protein